MGIIRSMLCVIPALILVFAVVACGEDCDMDSESFMNGSDRASAESLWSCNTGLMPITVQVYSNGTGDSSAMGPFTWNELGCRLFRVDGSAGQVLRVEGDPATGIITVFVEMDNGDTFSMGCSLETP
jgi:hypothetical protein